MYLLRCLTLTWLFLIVYMSIKDLPTVVGNIIVYFVRACLTFWLFVVIE